MGTRIRVHDTRLRRKVDLELRVPGRVSMYVCGPTVYEVPHVGHGRTALVFDVMRRYLAWRGLDVTYVTNVTNVEDKIIARAAEEGVSEPELADRYERAYWSQLDRLGVLRPDAVPRATEFIREMVDLIAELVGSGHAYVIEGEGVYFAVDTYPGYGELSGRRLDDLVESAGVRVERDEHKRNPADFALWKAAKPGEPAWDSPWGTGRPGWHIECSAMSLHILGDGFDLHGGGDDLVFPHHENERAQAEAAGHPFARYWVHAGMVMVGHEKMAKSLGNFTTLHGVLDAYGPRPFRLAALMSHYHSHVELGGKELDAARRAVAGLDALTRRARVAGVDMDHAVLDPAAVEAFRAAMDDDFGTPAALAVVFDVARRANVAIDDERRDEAATLVATVRELTGALGFAAPDGRPEELDDEVVALVAERDSARAARDFVRADRIREELARRGITLEDTPGGTVWHRR